MRQFRTKMDDNAFGGRLPYRALAEKAGEEKGRGKRKGEEKEKERKNGSINGDSPPPTKGGG